MVIAHLLLKLLVVAGGCRAISFTQRWEHLKTPEMKCTFAFPEKIGFNYQPSLIRGLPGLIESSHKWIKKANCSFKLTANKEAGRAYANGTYDGLVGMIQRNEIDSAWAIVRTDTLPYEPGKPTAPVFSADVIILSFPERAKDIERDIISFLNLEWPVIAYSLTGLFFFIPLVLVHDVKHQKDAYNPLVHLTSYLDKCSNVLYLLLDQEQFYPRRLVGFILTFTASVFTLFAISGILLNTVGANLIVTRLPHTIESLDDLFATNMTPMVTSNLFEYQAIESAPSGTKLHLLMQRIKEKVPDSLIKMNIDKGAGKVLSNVINKMLKNEAVTLLTKAFGEYALDCSCFVKELDAFKAFDRLHISSDSFAAGIMTGLMSNQIHPYTEKIISYLFTLHFETGQVAGFFDIVKPQIPDLYQFPGVKYDTSTVKCIEKVRRADYARFTRFALKHMAGLFHLWAILLIMSCFLLAFEVMFHQWTYKVDLNTNCYCSARSSCHQ